MINVFHENPWVVYHRGTIFSDIFFSSPIEQTYVKEKLDARGVGMYHKVPSGAGYITSLDPKAEVMGDGYGNGYYNRTDKGTNSEWANNRVHRWHMFPDNLLMLCAVVLAMDKSTCRF